jgi:glycosyltransferase involved in cell wall biosynthesis
VTSVLLLGMGRSQEQPGGLNRFVGALARALSERGLRVHTVAVRPSGLLPLRVISAARASRRVAGDVDVVDAHFALYAWWPVVAGALRHRPLVVHVHGSWAGESAADSWPVRQVKEQVERAVYRRAARVVVLSGAVRQVALDRYGVDPARLVVLAPGVDDEHFRPGPPARARLGLPAEGPVVLTVRRLVPRTGVEVLLNAVAGLPGAHLAVVGDGPERERLEQRARSLGARVTFAGRVSEADLPDWYRSADVSVVPSVAHEGWGLVVDESLSCGTPVVASRLGGLPEALDGFEDCLVPPGDPDALRTRLRSALDGVRPLPTPAACRAATQGRHWPDVAAATATLFEQVARPHLVVVGHCARPSGAELALVQLAPELSRRVELTVVLGEDGPVVDRLRALGVAVDLLPLSGRSPTGRRSAPGPAAALAAAAWSGRLARLLHRRRATLVHAWTTRAGLLAAPAARLAGVPLVCSARDRLAPDYLPDRHAAVLRSVADRCAAVVVANSSTTLATWRPARAPGVVVASPGVVRTAVPRAAGEPFTVGSLARLAPEKGQDLLLHAFAQAFPDGPERLRVLGGSWFDEHAWELHLRDTAVELSVADRVDLVGHRDDVAAELAHVDVVAVCPTTPEPFGQVVVDAMTAGRPVVAAAEGGPAETVTDGIDGLLVPPRDPTALAAALRRLRDDPALAAGLVRGGAATAADYTPGRLADQLLDIYAGVLACRR